jgi:CRISPR/Cas system-associated exonuclease Cas4 (RecB family)
MTNQISHLEHLSYSSISSYLLCPRNWKYKYVDQIKTRPSPALKFGSAVHNTIENILKQKAENENVIIAHRAYMEFFTQYFSDCRDDPEINWGFTNFDEQMAIAKRIFDQEEITSELSKLNPIEIETHVTLEVPNVPIPVIGYVDLIFEDGTPADIKTSSKKWGQSRADTELQPNFYLAALSQQNQTDILDGKFIYYILTKAKSPILQEVVTYRKPADLFFVYDLVKSVWDAISAGAFPHNPTGWKCSDKYCGYWDRCRGKYA